MEKIQVKCKDLGREMRCKLYIDGEYKGEFKHVFEKPEKIMYKKQLFLIDSILSYAVLKWKYRGKH